jgi:hypothetical protein
MDNLLEHVFNENYVEASNIFEDRLNSILEKKLVEMKKMIQSESFNNPYRDTKSKEQKGFVRASKVLPDPYSKSSPKLSAKISDTAKKTKKIRSASTTFANDDSDPATRERQSKLLKHAETSRRLMAPSAAQDSQSKYERAMERAKRLQDRGHATAVKRLKWSKPGMVARAGREGENFGRAIGGAAKNIISGLSGLAEE